MLCKRLFIRSSILTTPIRYNNIAVSLHWLVALLILAAFPLGLYMSDLVLSPTKLKLYSYHKWIGISVLALVVVRLMWRTVTRVPALPNSMKPWEKTAANVMHYVLYLMMLLVPLTGWLMSSAKGFQTVWFGVLPLPDLVGKDKALGELLKDWHENLNYLLLALVVVHVAAAMKHHFVARDGLLTRMMPWLGSRKRD